MHCSTWLLVFILNRKFCILSENVSSKNVSFAFVEFILDSLFKQILN